MMRARGFLRRRARGGGTCLLAACLAGAFLLPAAPAWPASDRRPGARPGPKKNEPIRITSNRMEANSKKNLIVFLGNVSAQQGDLQIQADRLEVYTKKKGAKKKKAGKASRPKGGPSVAEAASAVDRIVAIGSVILNQSKKKFAAGERLEYNETTGVAVLTGNPRAWEGNNQVVGSKIEIFLREDRTIVYGTTTRRVNVTLFPESDGAQGAPGKGRGRP